MWVSASVYFVVCADLYCAAGVIVVYCVAGVLVVCCEAGIIVVYCVASVRAVYPNYARVLIQQIWPR